MKISISVPSSTAGAPPAVRVLGDDAARDFISGFAPDARALVQTGRYPQAASVTKFARQNIETSFGFVTERVHASYAAAQNFLARELAEVPGLKGTMTIAQIGGSGGSTLRLEAVISGVRVISLSGVTTLIQYTVEGGAFTLTSTT